MSVRRGFAVSDVSLLVYGFYGTPFCSAVRFQCRSTAEKFARSVWIS